MGEGEENNTGKIVVGVLIVLVVASLLYVGVNAMSTSSNANQSYGPPVVAPSNNANTTTSSTTNTTATQPAVVATPSTYPTKWQCLGDISVPIRRENNANKEVSCLSTDGWNCAWSSDMNGCNAVLDQQYNNPNLKPLVCGADHQSKYGITGYGDSNHWCYKGSNLINKV